MPQPASTISETSLTLEQKIGQVMIIAFDGTTIDAELRRMISEYHIGAVILFARNVQSPRQVAALTSELQKISLESGSPGLFIAIDQEGGRVARLTEDKGFTQFPSAMALSAAGDADGARRAARVIATEMKAVGLDVNFAPVLDVNNNPANTIMGTRSFGSDPQRVAEFGVAFLEGLQSEGVLAFGKHFPGKGDTSVDAHIALPTVSHDRALMEAVGLVPFKAAIAADVAGIMSAHVVFPAFDPDGTPSTLSHHVLTGLLREEMGYEGLLVTDSLEMGALSNTLGLNQPQAAAAALQAGADLLLFNRDHDQQREAHALILQKVQRGEIPLVRLDEAVLRVLRAKERFNLLSPLLPDPASAASQVFTSAHRTLADELAVQSITLLRDDPRLLPLTAEAHPYVLEIPALTGLGHLLGQTTITLSDRPSAAEIRNLVDKARQGRPIIVGVVDVAHNPTQADLINALLQTGAPMILIAARDPYDLMNFHNAPTMLATHGSPPSTLRGLAAVLNGRAKPGGHLPVELPGLFSYSAGLDGFETAK